MATPWKAVEVVLVLPARAVAVGEEEAVAAGIEFKEMGLAAVEGGEQHELADGGVVGIGRPWQGHEHGAGVVSMGRYRSQVIPSKQGEAAAKPR